jgi:hypothetical protein
MNLRRFIKLPHRSADTISDVNDPGLENVASQWSGYG